MFTFSSRAPTASAQILLLWQALRLNRDLFPRPFAASLTLLAHSHALRDIEDRDLTSSLRSLAARTRSCRLPHLRRPLRHRRYRLHRPPRRRHHRGRRILTSITSSVPSSPDLPGIVTNCVMWFVPRQRAHSRRALHRPQRRLEPHSHIRWRRRSHPRVGVVREEPTFVGLEAVLVPQDVLCSNPEFLIGLIQLVSYRSTGRRIQRQINRTYLSLNERNGGHRRSSPDAG